MAQVKVTSEMKCWILAAQKCRFDWSKVCSQQLHDIVYAHVGAPMKFIFISMLTVAASFIRTNGVLNINPEWRGPAILWTIVAARKGEKKTPALKRLLKQLR